MKILGIETSCDETAVSIVEAKGKLDSLDFKLLGSGVNSQIKIHEQYGGVVPNLAKREHTKNLPIVLEEALKKAGTDLSKIDLITVTVGPGLEPALWTGITFAEELGKKWNIPVFGTNHMIGHIASVLFNNTEENSKFEIRNSKQIQNSKPQIIKFPAIALLVSGGHTELVLLKSWVEKETIGETLDDAVGEAFDKVARMLGLPYPGGPEISRLAEQAREQNIHLETKFPRPMIHSKDFNFSFSGLKTAVLYYLRSLTSPPSPLPLSRGGGEENESSLGGEVRMAVAREFEDAVIETLLSKTKAAIEKHSPKTLIIGGGVIANKALRKTFLDLKEVYRNLPAQAGIGVLIPEKTLTTDNATMIAAAGYIKYLIDGKPDTGLKACGNLNIS